MLPAHLALAGVPDSASIARAEGVSAARQSCERPLSRNLHAPRATPQGLQSLPSPDPFPVQAGGLL